MAQCGHLMAKCPCQLRTTLFSRRCRYIADKHIRFGNRRSLATSDASFRQMSGLVDIRHCLSIRCSTNWQDSCHQYALGFRRIVPSQSVRRFPRSLSTPIHRATSTCPALILSQRLLLTHHITPPTPRSTPPAPPATPPQTAAGRHPPAAIAQLPHLEILAVTPGSRRSPPRCGPATSAAPR